MNIKILCNDEARNNFSSEHGLSILINNKILFDTGQTNVIIKNSKKLGVNLNEIEKIFISHGHYDHVGGLKYLKDIINAPIFIHKDAIIPKFSGTRFAGAPFDWNTLKSRLIFLENDKLIDNIYILNSVPTCENLIDKKFFKNGKHDLFSDEINLIINNVLFTGCAHRGIENILKKAMEIQKIRFVIGGFHLINASIERIQKIINLFKTYDVSVIPLHCTGGKAISLMKKELGNKCIILKACDEWRL
jgi:7,8-dihydropterin-6-yl-methyl-4-(beta-D-ribofuranosyl)aminobenzene 5'-phosphate synthase